MTILQMVNGLLIFCILCLVIAIVFIVEKNKKKRKEITEKRREF